MIPAFFFAEFKRHASKRGRNRPETIYFLGFSVLQEYADMEVT